jgi:hypothetical protein
MEFLIVYLNFQSNGEGVLCRLAGSRHFRSISPGSVLDGPGLTSKRNRPFNRPHLSPSPPENPPNIDGDSNESMETYRTVQPIKFVEMFAFPTILRLHWHINYVKS